MLLGGPKTLYEAWERVSWGPEDALRGVGKRLWRSGGGFHAEKVSGWLLDPHDAPCRVRFCFVNVQRAVYLVVRHRIVRRGAQRIDCSNMRR